MLAVYVVAQVGLRFAKQAPAHQRGFWLIALMALPVLPAAFVYGRNSARRDGLGKLSRAFVVGAVVCVLLGGFLGGQWLIFEGLGTGFLLGYALGWLVRNKAHKNYGDTLEADQYLNIVRSERIHASEHPAAAFLNSQDVPTRRLLRILSISEVFIMLGAFALALWPVFADKFDVLLRALYVRSGDGTRVFVTLDPIVVAFALILLSIIVCGLAFERLLPFLAGSKRDAWLEYYRLLHRRQHSPLAARIGKAIVCAMVCAAILTLVLYADTYTKVTDEGIVLNRFWGLGARFYPWNEVTGVEVGRKPYTCSEGHRHVQLTVKITFADGTDWVPDTTNPRRAGRIESAARYAAAKTEF